VRGCFFVLIAAAALVVTVAWFAAPVLASTVVGAMLQASGYSAARSSVEVEASPPIAMLFGHADLVRIDGDDVAWHTFHATSLELTLRDVDLFGRRAAAIDGSIGGVRLGAGGSASPDTPTADIAVAGSANDAGATIEIPTASVERILRAAVEMAVGRPIASATLAAPDRVQVVTELGTIEGRLSIDPNGALVLRTPVSTVMILAFDAAFPLQLTAVTATANGIRLDGRLDVQELLGG
jgi:hypothetical protein